MYGVIVEGPYDEKVVVQAAPHVEILVLHGNGFGWNRERIDQLVNRCDIVFVLTDPDVAGELVATKIKKAYPETYRIYVDPEQAKKKINKKYRCGVEYCSVDYLREVITSSIQSRNLYASTS